MHSHWADTAGHGRTGADRDVQGRTEERSRGRRTERALRRGACVARATNECGRKIVAYYCEALVGFTTSTHRRACKPPPLSPLSLSLPWWCWVLAGYQCALSVEFNRHIITIRSLEAERSRSSNCGRPSDCVCVNEWVYLWMYVHVRVCVHVCSAFESNCCFTCRFACNALWISITFWLNCSGRL